MFLVDKRDPLEADPQLREMRSLEIRERRLRVEQLESSREQEINALRQSAGLARFDGMSGVELHGELARMLLENLLWPMDVVRRRAVLQAFLQPDSSLQDDAEFQFQLRLFRMLTPPQQEQLLCQHDIKKVPTAVLG